MAALDFPEISIPALVILTITSFLIILWRDSRGLVITLAIQYIGVFVLVFLSWSMVLASVKLIAGWMAAALLWIGVIASPHALSLDERFSPGRRVFRLLVSLLVFFTMLSTAATVADWFPGLGIERIYGALILIGLGALQLGLTTRPFRVTLGLLTLLSGFEILYAALENSALVAGLLAGLNLGLALVGVYLISAIPAEVDV
jgi:hypothetical protein